MDLSHGIIVGQKMETILYIRAGLDGFQLLISKRPQRGWPKSWTDAIHLLGDFVAMLFYFVQNVKLPTLLSRTPYITILVCSFISLSFISLLSTLLT